MAKTWNDNLAEFMLNYVQKHHGDFPSCNSYACAAHNGGTGNLIALHPNADPQVGRKCKTPKYLPDSGTGCYPSFTPEFIDEVMVGKWEYRKKVVNPHNITSEDEQWMKDNVRRHDLYFSFGHPWGGHAGVLLGGWVELPPFGEFDLLVIWGRYPYSLPLAIPF